LNPVGVPAGTDSDFVSAAQAAKLLRVKPQTLYTYVSRGLIRSIAQRDQKSRLYYREDLEKLRSRSNARHGAEPAAESAIRWGQPVINTSITEITPGGPRYRGRLALDLAREGRSFESVAELLWTGIQHHEPLLWEHELIPRDFKAQLDRVVLQRELPPLLRILAAATAVLGVAEPSHSEIRRGTTIPAARQLILTLTGCLGYLGANPGFRFPDPRLTVAQNAAQTLIEKPSAEMVDAINAALVLCADHELSSSTFAARVAASTGAELRACVLAAIGAHSGELLGGSCDRAEDLLQRARTKEDVHRRLIELEQAETRVPGFNLLLYPQDDPRARYLLHRAHALSAGDARAQLIDEFIEEAERRLQLWPSLEVGLVALAATLELPERSASALWAVGRTAGWIAHVMEQRLAGFVLRPRARYVSVK
jgi:citrate synthase